MKALFPNKQIDILLGLGLNKIQVILYLTVLKHGTSSVLELSKLTGISRQQIYDETGGLVDKGLLEATNKQRRKYIAAGPRKLIKLGETKINETRESLEELTSILPLLETLPIRKKNKIVIKYFEGLDKIREAYGEELDVSKGIEVLSLAGSIDNIFEFFPETYWDRWNKKFIKQNSKSRMIVHNSDIAKQTSNKDQIYNRETRYLQEFSLKVNIDIFNNTILIVSFHDETAVWIESDVLAQSYRIMFETLWQLSKTFK